MAKVKGDLTVTKDIIANNLSGTNTGDQTSSDFDHDALQNTHNLTTDIDHNSLTNTHNLTTDIDHDGLTNTHNLTTDISHNGISDLQGGTTNEYYHLTNAEHTIATTKAASGVDGYLDGDDFATFDAKQNALTFGIADTNKVQINSASVADDDYAKFTATGLEGRSYTEVISDISAVADFDNGAYALKTTGTVKSGIEEIAVRNDTGSQIDAFKVVKTVGDYSTSSIPKVGLVASLTDRPIGVITANLATATTGSAVKRGRISCTGFDASGATIGDKVYSTATGALTLTITSLEIGYVLDNANPAIVYFNIGGAGGGSSVVGTYKRLGCLDIDGSTNTVDTDYGLYTVGASTYAKTVKVYICNRNGGYTARIRLAHVDGAVGDVAVADYILFDDYLLPYETKIVELDGMVATDTLLVRSSVSLVNFEACGEELTTDVYRKRVGALDIDGTTNAIDTDKVVYTSDRATKVNVLICNRNSGYVAECQVAHVNSDDIADIADEDRKFFTLDVNQTLFLELDLNMAINEIISFRSDTTNVNCLVYLAE